MVWWKIHVECGGCVKVVSSQSIWMDWMRLSIWNSPSSCPHDCHLSVDECSWWYRIVFGDQCRMWAVGCAPKVQLEESPSGGIVPVVVGDPGFDVVLLDVVEKQIGE